MNRSVHEGYSGGEKKKSEVLQMSLLKPKLAILKAFKVMMSKELVFLHLDSIIIMDLLF